MENVIINVEHLTKDFGDNKGVFDLSFQIKKGEMVGIIGTNGSGKSTTIRSILGFIKPTSGHCYVLGLESWKHSSDFIRQIGYVPGEIAFPDLLYGTDFLKGQAEILKVKDYSNANKLIEVLKLDPSANLKRMSKGMKQKTALVAALIHDPDILILDEPTTGLDPLMRINFLNILKEEHLKGKTIFMSSQSFEELEDNCDRVIFLLDGHLIGGVDIKDIKTPKKQEFKIEFTNKADYEKFKKLYYQIVRDQPQYNQVTILVDRGKVDQLLTDLTTYKLKFITEIKYTLEKHFKKVAGFREENSNNV